MGWWLSSSYEDCGCRIERLCHHRVTYSTLYQEYRDEVPIEDQEWGIRDFQFCTRLLFPRTKAKATRINGRMQSANSISSSKERRCRMKRMVGSCDCCDSYSVKHPCHLLIEGSLMVYWGCRETVRAIHSRKGRMNTLATLRGHAEQRESLIRAKIDAAIRGEELGTMSERLILPIEARLNLSRLRRRHWPRKCDGSGCVTICAAREYEFLRGRRRMLAACWKGLN